MDCVCVLTNSWGGYMNKKFAYSTLDVIGGEQLNKHIIQNGEHI